MVDEEKIALVVWEVLVNNAKVDGTFIPNRDIPAAIAAGIAEYDWQQHAPAEHEPDESQFTNDPLKK